MTARKFVDACLIRCVRSTPRKSWKSRPTWRGCVRTRNIYEQLKRSPKSKKLQRELIDSVSALHQYSSNFSEEDYSALLIEWVQSLIDIFSLYSFDDLLFAEGDQEFLVLVMMWVEYLSVQTSVAEDTDYFISHYQSVLSLVSSLASNQSNINTKIYYNKDIVFNQDYTIETKFDLVLAVVGFFRDIFEFIDEMG